MARMPSSVAEFLSGKRFAVAGVSRQRQQAANAIFRKLRASGFEVVPVNPNATQVEGVRCYPDLVSISGDLDGVVIATHPRNALEVVRQCTQCEVRRVWFHRAFGQGSVSNEAVHECSARGIQCIVGGCPLMYCEPVDFGHRCMRWLLRFGGKVPV
jgi:predicted CoA-binding protein